MNKIIQGDALEILKSITDNSIDMGVTSPPYNKQENKKGWLVRNVKYDIASDKQSEEDYQEKQVAVLNELWRVIKEGGSFFYNHKTRWEQGKMLHPYEWLNKTKWTLRQEIIWDRMIAANIRGWRFWQTDERIYWLYKPKKDHKIGKELLSKHALLTSIWRFPPERKNLHPAPFPLTLPLRCIYSILDESKGTVIDPYVGSGTTLVAAKLLGHNYIGIDISPEYIKMSQEFLKKTNAYGSILEQELSKHKVSMTFEERKKSGKFVGKFKTASKLDFSTTESILSLF